MSEDLNETVKECPECDTYLDLDGFCFHCGYQYNNK